LIDQNLEKPIVIYPFPGIGDERKKTGFGYLSILKEKSPSV
jgi:hypothetical protein